MPDVLIATDADWIFDDVDAALSDEDTRVVRVRRGPRRQRGGPPGSSPTLIVLDMQIGNMGGIATALNLEQEFEDGTTPVAPILLLLDRPADVPLARRWARRRLAGQAARLVPPAPGRPGPARGRHLRGAVGPRRLTPRPSGRLAGCRWLGRVAGIRGCHGGGT